MDCTWKTSFRLCLLVAAVGQTLSACPDLPSMRSNHVNGGGFDPAKLAGVWYEAAFQDVAQVGATCPVLNVTVDPATRVVSMALNVRYGKIPFTIVEVYTPKNDTTPGL